jgi:hypothetical protein
MEEKAARQKIRGFSQDKLEICHLRGMIEFFRLTQIRPIPATLL